MSTPVFEPPKLYQCQGIGKGAKCGKPALVPLRSNKWNAESESMDEITVHVCQDHATELQTAMQRNRALITPDHTLRPGEQVKELPSVTQQKNASQGKEV